MVDDRAGSRWERASSFYDLFFGAEQRRLEPHKRRVFSRARGRVLIVGVGTGLDLALLPQELDVVAIDISPGMLERARERAQSWAGRCELLQEDVRSLSFADGSFDTVLGACVFCSVPQPARGLREVRRVLRKDGRLLLVEHVRSRLGPVAVMQDLMTLASRRFGPDMNRDTVSTLLRCGFELVREENLYMDIVKAIEAKPL